MQIAGVGESSQPAIPHSHEPPWGKHPPSRPTSSPVCGRGGNRPRTGPHSPRLRNAQLAGHCPHHGQECLLGVSHLPSTTPGYVPSAVRGRNQGSGQAMGGHWRPPRQPLMSSVIPGVARSQAQVPEGARALSIPCLDRGQVELLRARPLHTQWGCHGGPPQPHRHPGKQGGETRLPSAPPTPPHGHHPTLPRTHLPPPPAPHQKLECHVARRALGPLPPGSTGGLQKGFHPPLLFLRPPSRQGGPNPTNGLVPTGH